MIVPQTPSQTAGPFFHIGLTHLCRAEFADARAPGERVTIEGRVLDGDGAPVNDALIEVWQADANGRYRHAEAARATSEPTNFTGFGRVATDDAGAFRFSTIKPGAVIDRGRTQAPHLVVAVFMRGLLKHLVTRIYFPDESANATDPTLTIVPAERRATLVAKRISATTLAWNIVLQGKDETVFFDY